MTKNLDSKNSFNGCLKGIYIALILFLLTIVLIAALRNERENQRLLSALDAQCPGTSVGNVIRGGDSVISNWSGIDFFCEEEMSKEIKCQCSLD